MRAEAGLTPEERALLAEARRASEAAYCPYSAFPVGAVVETEIGRFGGGNIENASYGLAVCAERVALFTAVAAGAKRITRLAVCCAGASEDDPPGSRMPCGACRQVMAELMAPDALVLIDGVGAWTVVELLPEAFHLDRRPFFEER